MHYTCTHTHGYTHPDTQFSIHTYVPIVVLHLYIHILLPRLYVFLYILIPTRVHVHVHIRGRINLHIHAVSKYIIPFNSPFWIAFKKQRVCGIDAVIDIDMDIGTEIDTVCV